MNNCKPETNFDRSKHKYLLKHNINEEFLDYAVNKEIIEMFLPERKGFLENIIFSYNKRFKEEKMPIYSLNEISKILYDNNVQLSPHEIVNDKFPVNISGKGYEFIEAKSARLHNQKTESYFTLKFNPGSYYGCKGSYCNCK